MPGIEIKGRSKRANYRHGGRTGYAIGSVVKAGKMIARRLRKPKPHRDKPPSKTHKDVPTMAAEGGRIGFQEGKRVDVPPSSQWKKPSTSLTREGVKDLHRQIKDRPKKLKFRC